MVRAALLLSVERRWVQVLVWSDSRLWASGVESVAAFDDGRGSGRRPSPSSGGFEGCESVDSDVVVEFA